MFIHLGDRSFRQQVGVLEDILVKVGRLLILGDFTVMDRDKGSQVLIVLGRPFLATAGVMINVAAGKLSFQLCGARIDVPMKGILNQEKENPRN